METRRKGAQSDRITTRWNRLDGCAGEVRNNPFNSGITPTAAKKQCFTWQTALSRLCIRCQFQVDRLPSTCPTCVHNDLCLLMSQRLSHSLDLSLSPSPRLTAKISLLFARHLPLSSHIFCHADGVKCEYNCRKCPILQLNI